MTQSAPALIDLVTKTVGTPVSDGHGGFTVLPDNDMIMYRLMDIPTDNYSAFLKEAKEFLNMAMQMETHVRAVTYEQIVREARAIERYYQVSVTGKSSEQGKFIKELLKDETMQKHVFKTEGGRNVLERFAMAQGDDRRMDDV